MPMRDEQIGQNRVEKRVLVVSLLTVVVAVLGLNGDRWVLAQEGSWTAPTVISAPPGFSWFPDLTVDPFGSVHVVWCLTIPLEDSPALQEQVNYTRWDGESWSEPNDIVPRAADIVRNAITSDQAGNIHLLFGGSVYNVLTLYYQKAPASEAWSAAAWSTPHRINQGASYIGDIAVDSQGVIHVVYDDTIDYTGDGKQRWADTFYRHSTDGGQTWSAPVNLYPEPLTRSAKPYMEIDNNDVIHVTWDERWEPFSGEKSDTYYSIYTSSSDGGKTWTPPTVIDYPQGTVVQLTVGSDGKGGVMLVWRATASDELFYQWSTDGGHSWGVPSVIPGVFARPWTNPFDMYDMATDSTGLVHLLVVGRGSQAADALLGVYHLVWDGDHWSAPTRIFAKPGLYPEYPKIVVHEGNQLHTVWFTREGSVWDQSVTREVWYSSSQSPAPYQPVTPWPTPTPEPPTATPTSVPTATPYPTLSLEGTGLPGGLRTESDDLVRLIVALSPVVLVILVVVVVKAVGFSRLRR